MEQNEVIMLVGGILAAVLGGIDAIRSGSPSLTSVGVVVLGIVFVLLALL